MNIKAEDLQAVIKYFLDKSLPEKKGFFPSRMEFKWVKINSKKALNESGYLNDYGKEKLLMQSIKGEFGYRGYRGPIHPSNDDVKEVLKSVKEDMIAKGAW